MESVFSMWIKDEKQSGLYKRTRDTEDVWAVKARIKGGSPITHTIGKTSLFTAPQARAEAKRVLALLAQGIHPNLERKKQKEVQLARELPLSLAIENYAKMVTWKQKTRNDALATLKRRFDDWYDKPLASITKEDCQTRFLKIKDDVLALKSERDRKRIENNKPIKTYRNEVGLGEAQRAFRYLSAIFSSYSQDDAGEEKLLPKGNPCLILKVKKLRKALQPRERFLNDAERDCLYDMLGNASHPDYPGSIKRDDMDLVWLLIHTGLRLDEALDMKWTAVNFTSETFTAFDTKNHRDHELSMTDATKSMFTRRYTTKGKKQYVFASPLDVTKPMSASRTFQRLSCEAGFDFTAHDLRRTVATVASQLGYDIDAIGALLNHAKQGVTASYVQRTRTKIKEILEDIQEGLFSATRLH